MRFISLTISIVFILISFLALNIKRKKNIFIFDIDNTICDTWKSLPRTKTRDLSYIINERKRVNNLLIFPRVKELLNEKIDNNKNAVFLLSARNIYLWDKTYNYFRNNNLKISIFSIFLTPKPNDKLILLRLILFLKNKEQKINYYDDLSYNHEYGNVFYYNHIINNVRKMNLKYYDYSYIKKLQEFN